MTILIRISTITLFFVLTTCNLYSQSPNKKINACNIWQQKKSLQFIKSNARHLLINSKDECVLSLLDTLGEMYIKKGTIEFLICLDSLYHHSDGYVSEYFLEVGEKIFFNSFSQTMKYMYKNQLTGQPNIKQLIIYSISSKLSNSKDSKIEKKKIFNFMDKEMQKKQFSINEKLFIQKLKGEFDEKLFD